MALKWFDEKWIIHRLPSKVDLAKLAKQVESLKFLLDGSGAEMANKQSGGIPAEFHALETLHKALEEISILRQSPPKHVMVNRLPPGCQVPEHTDTLVGYEKLERWHLPLVTNDSAKSYWEGQELIMYLGSWWGPVPYWKPHRVENLGLHERVHLVVDLSG